MRAWLAFVFAAIVSLQVLTPAVAVGADDNGSISRDARGAQPVREHDPLGGPMTPRLYLLGQTLIFTAGVTLLVIAAVLGAYTFISSRRSPPRRGA
jgi:hypothetical protein